MIAVYLRTDYCISNLEENQFWTLAPNVLSWLEENCTGQWRLCCDEPFTWEMYNDWLGDCIDSIMDQKSRYGSWDTELRSYPHKICKPHIMFSDKNDALLFKLSF